MLWARPFARVSESTTITLNGRRCKAWPRLLAWHRYTSARVLHHNNTTTIRVGGSGCIQLDIARNQVTSRAQSNDFLLYFPPGPLPSSDVPKPTTFIKEDILERIPSVTFITIHYRLSPKPGEGAYRFPIPVHDVAAAFHYLTSGSRLNDTQDTRPRICLMGSHIGGALATMLALTEPAQIHALAVSEPMVDWVGLDEALVTVKANVNTPPPTLSRKRSSAATTPTPDPASLASAAQCLINLRTRLFPTPSSYFDPFASPTLFLRAPGRDTPQTPTSTVPPDAIALGDLNDYYDELNISGQSQPQSSKQQQNLDAFGPYDDDWPLPTPPSTSPSESSPPTKRRKVLRRWPSITAPIPNPAHIPSGILLPHTKIFLPPPHDASGHAMLLRAQGLELAELMRRACFFGRESGVGTGRVQVGEAQGTEKESGIGRERERVEWLVQKLGEER